MFWFRIVFFKQQTAYEMRISDWSSDVCSSDLCIGAEPQESDRRSRHVRRSGQNLGNRDRVEDQIGAEDTEHEAQIADAIDDERLDRGGIGARLLAPETDQQIARQPHAFPAEEIGRASWRERVSQYV